MYYSTLVESNREAYELYVNTVRVQYGILTGGSRQRDGTSVVEGRDGGGADVGGNGCVATNVQGVDAPRVFSGGRGFVIPCPRESRVVSGGAQGSVRGGNLPDGLASGGSCIAYGGIFGDHVSVRGTEATDPQVGLRDDDVRSSQEVVGPGEVGPNIERNRERRAQKKLHKANLRAFYSGQYLGRFSHVGRRERSVGGDKGVLDEWKLVPNSDSSGGSDLGQSVLTPVAMEPPLPTVEDEEVSA